MISYADLRVLLQAIQAMQVSIHLNLKGSETDLPDYLAGQSLKEKILREMAKREAERL